MPYTSEDHTPWPEDVGVVVFPDGRRVRGRGLRKGAPQEALPHFGLYLMARDPGPFEWNHQWVRWPDFRRPSDTQHAIQALSRAFELASTQRVELACNGGVGRTGTAIAAMAVLAGIDPDEAVAWTRTNYHHRAVETPGQRRWVHQLRI